MTKALDYLHCSPAPLLLTTARRVVAYYAFSLCALCLPQYEKAVPTHLHLLFHNQVRRGTRLWQTLLPIEHWWPAKLPAERGEGGCLVLCA